MVKNYIMEIRFFLQKNYTHNNLLIQLKISQDTATKQILITDVKNKFCINCLDFKLIKKSTLMPKIIPFRCSMKKS